MLCPRCGVANTQGNVFCTGCGNGLAGATPSGNTTWAFTPQAWAQSLLGRTLEQRYRLESILGTGGMGTVFRATRLHIGDQIAVKVLHPMVLQDAEAPARFHREAQAAARLKHHNAIAVHDFAASGDICFLAMELFEGQSLGQLIREYKGPLPAPLAVNIVAQVCAALDAAHLQGIIHRDIKPDNILVSGLGTDMQVKVLDFGIAKLRDQSGNLTRTGNILGTPQYMSPEQCLGEELDGRSDIYSLGIVLYEMLTGHVPFDAPSLAAVIGQHVHKTPPPLRALNSTLPPALEAVVLRALDKNPAARPNTAGQLAQELKAALTVQTPAVQTGPAQAHPTATQIFGSTLRQQPSPPPAKSNKMLIAGALAGLAIILLAVVLWRGLSQNGNQPAQPGSKKPPAGMVYVPGGEFEMGSDRLKEFAAPVHKVDVKPFFMDIYEVTCAEYKKFIDATGHPAPSQWDEKNYPSGKQNFPVTGVTWDDAKAYAQWAGKRLPTEEEWEFAARGTDGRRYPWGDFWQDNTANVAETKKGGMVAVGSYPKGASPFGIQDMLGNAWEWTDTDLKAYPGGMVPPAVEQKDPKIMRGGSWEGQRDTISATFRSWWGAREQKTYQNTGLRCVKDAPPPD